MKKIRETVEKTLLEGDNFVVEYDRVEKILGRYFTDKQFLKTIRSSGDAISLALQISKLREYRDANHIFNVVLKALNSIVLTQEAVAILNKENDRILETQNFMWSKDRLSETLAQEDLYKAVTQIFDAINTLCEGAVKHYINILYLVEQQKGEVAGKDKSFGEKVSALAVKYPFLKIKNINISQWRNIADHRDYKIVDSNIICNYSSKTIVMSKKELIRVLNKITLIYNALYLAFTLFVYNHIEIFHLSKDMFRDEIWLDNLKISFSYKNFLIERISDADIFVVTIKDCLDYSSKKEAQMRLIECSQYMINFWAFVQKSMRLIFTDKENKIIAKIFYNNDDLVYMTTNNLCISYMAEKIVFEYISNDYC